MNALSGKRILVIEDEGLIAAMLEDVLTQLGASVIGPAATIAEGLSLAAKEHIDAAVLDVNIRSQRIDPVTDVLESRGIPMVFTTGYAETRSVRNRNVPFLQKPYTQDKLASALASALNG